MNSADKAAAEQLLEAVGERSEQLALGDAERARGQAVASTAALSSHRGPSDAVMATSVPVPTARPPDRPEPAWLQGFARRARPG